MVDFIFIFIFFPRQQRLGNGDEDADHVFGDATLTTSINVSTIYYPLALFNRKIIIVSEFCWNCRKLDNSQTVNISKDFVINYELNILFLMKIKVFSSHM